MLEDLGQIPALQGGRLVERAGPERYLSSLPLLAAGLLFWLSRSAVLNARAVDRQQKVLKRSNQALLASDHDGNEVLEARLDSGEKGSVRAGG